jgi:hypothetical protein
MSTLQLLKPHIAWDGTNAEAECSRNSIARWTVARSMDMWRQTLSNSFGATVRVADYPDAAARIGQRSGVFRSLSAIVVRKC